MNSEYTRNHAHRDLESLDLERTMTSSVSHIAAATQAQAAHRNRTCTGVRQETRDGKLVGRPYSYVGRYVDNVETDERAVVSLKDGTTRIGPWANGKPIGDWRKDHELLSVAPPRSRPTPPDCRTEKRAPTITPRKKRKQSPVMTSREKKNRKFCAASARPCRDQQSLQETHERNHEMSVQQAEMAALEGEDEEKVNEMDQRARSCRDSADQQSLQEATDRETNERNQETSIQQVETTASKEEDEEKVIETYQGAHPSRDSAHQQSMQETTEHNQEMFIQQVESTALKEEDEENGIETDQDREEEITVWLITVIGYNPSTKLMREYAKQFMNLGLHSSRMISDLLPANRVSTFEWMKEFHRVQFLSNANLKI
jgi:hypothetical protein